MTIFQRWLMAALFLSCLVLSFYSYTINHNLQVIEARQRVQIATTGESLWFSWYKCVEELSFAMNASDQNNQAHVLEYLSNAELYCQLSTQFIYSYDSALGWPIKPWWNLSLTSSGNGVGFVNLFIYYPSKINQIHSSIKEESLVSSANRVQIQQLHNDIKIFAAQIPEAMLQEGDIDKIHEALAGWCGMVNDVKAKETIILTEEQYRGVCRKESF